MENILTFQGKLAKKHGYIKLNNKLSREVREKYLVNLPGCLDINGNKDFKIYTLSNTLIANGYNRIVIGDYGAFIEFDNSQIIRDKIIVKHGEEYRFNDSSYMKNIKYYWLTAIDNSNIKIYYQKRIVSYADYKPKMFYVTPYEIIT